MGNGLDTNKIAFIMCTNDELYEQECISYIERLKMPTGFTREILTIKGAASMAAGYNQAMKQSQAKYKVYLHQDVFILCWDFIEKILELFQEPEIGMIGMVGNLKVDKEVALWYGNRVGMLHSNSLYFALSYLFGKVEGKYQEVQAVDGLLMATQYDVPWREDIFQKWDFYDVSQCMEFRRQGYRIVVPHMEHPWCIHDDGILNLDNYYSERDKFINEYFGGTVNG